MINRSEKYTILMLSNQPFDFELKTNKWHISTRLAKLGHQVIFVDPPVRFQALKRFLKHPSVHLATLFFSTEIKTDHLLVYRPANIFNFKPFSVLNTLMHTRNMRKFLKERGIVSSKTVLWVYHFDFPELPDLIERIAHDVLIYDVVDDYTEFPEYANRKKINTGIISLIQRFDDELKIRLNQNGLSGKKWVLHREEWLVKKADVVLVSAPGLITKCKKWRKDVWYLPNAGSPEYFDKPKATFVEPKDLSPIPHPRIGFSGAIDNYKNDISLIEACAETYPKYQFILIGPEKVADPDLDLTKLKSLKNVHFLGKKPWEETPAYFNHFDAYFIPYNIKTYTGFPVKYFEALGAGLPTVVTDLPAYQGFDVDGYVSKTDAEFVRNIKRAIDENTPERIKKRKKLAGENSYDGKIEKQLHLISSALDHTSYVK